MATLALLMVFAAASNGAAANGRGSDAVVGAEWGCEGDVVVTSEHRAISNIIISSDAGEEKVEEPFEGAEVFEYTFQADDHPGLDGVYVKAGNNGHRGRGEHVPLSEPVCDDGDGFSVEDGDCDDTDGTIYPGAPETPNDGIDQDCDGADLVLADGDLRFTLQWTAEPSESVDMDLYVIDPNGDRVAFYNPSVASGGTQDRDDDQCSSAKDGQSIESIHWPTGMAPAGTYTIGVDEFGRCRGATGPASWTVSVYVDGVLAASHSGVGDDDPTRLEAGPSNTFTFDHA